MNCSASTCHRLHASQHPHFRPRQTSRKIRV